MRGSLSSVAAIVLLASSCGGGGDQSSNVGYGGAGSSSCKFGYAAGSSASDLGEQAVTTSFGKRYPSGRLSGILSASAQETVRQMGERGVTVFGMRDSVAPGACNFFAPVPDAGSALQRKWDSASAEITGGDKDATLLGVYISEGDTMSLGGAYEPAMIGVRRDADRYTLVHEYMHHLFELQRRTDGEGKTIDFRKSGEAVEKEFEDALGDLKYSYGEGGKVAMMRVVNAYVHWSRLVRQLAVRFPLEEVTIESELLPLAKSGRLEYAPLDESSSHNYIAYSGMRAAKLMEAVSEIGSKVRSECYSKSLYSECSEVGTEMVAADNMGKQARAAISGSIDYLTRNGTQHIVGTGAVRCSHEAEAEAMLDRAQAIAEGI